MVVGATVTITTIVANVSQVFGITFPNPIATPSPTPTLTPTPIPPPLQFGNPIFDISFSRTGEGKCNDYDSNLLGYDAVKRLYYIIPENNGFISVCHENDSIQAQGILQATALVDSDTDYFGYAVFFGWQGQGVSTTDVCGFGIRQNQTKIEGFFVQKIRDQRTEPPIEPPVELDNNMFDKNPHTIFLMLYPSGRAIGYLDGNFVAESKFVNCQTGPIGLIAYGPGEVRINFTSLKLFTLP